MNNITKKIQSQLDVLIDYEFFLKSTVIFCIQFTIVGDTEIFLGFRED